MPQIPLVTKECRSNRCRPKMTPGVKDKRKKHGSMTIANAQKNYATNLKAP